MTRSIQTCKSAQRLASSSSMLDVCHAAEAGTRILLIAIASIRQIPIDQDLKAIYVASIYPIGVAVFRDLRFQCLYLLF